MKSDTSDPQVVSVTSPPQVIDTEYSPKSIGVEKKTKTPKIFQKLLQRKSVDHALPPSTSPTISLTSSASGTVQGTPTLVQSQQEFLSSMSPGKTRRRTLFKHGQGTSSSILASSSSSSSAHSKIPCGYECGILRLGILIVKSKYLYFEENPSLYNLLSKYGYSEHEATVSDPVYSNSSIDKDIFPLKIPFSTIIGISKNVNDFSYEINVYTSTETTHTIVFEDITAYQNAHTQIEKVMAHKRHSAFSLVRRSTKMESVSITDDDSHGHHQRKGSNDAKQSVLRYGQQVENVRISDSPPPPMYYPPQTDDGFYESDDAALETNTRSKRKKHKKKKERKSEFDEYPVNDNSNCNDESGLDVPYKKDVDVDDDDDDVDEEEMDYVDDNNDNTNSMCREVKEEEEEEEEEEDALNNSPDIQAVKDNNISIEKKENDNMKGVENDNDNNNDKKQENWNEEGKEKEKKEEEEEEEKKKKKKRKREKRRERMVASSRHPNEPGFVTNAVYFILGVIVTVLVQHIF